MSERAPDITVEAAADGRAYQQLFWSLHRKEGRKNEQSDCLSFAKLDKLNRMNIVIRIG
jgi:hypothetical protein